MKRISYQNTIIEVPHGAKFISTDLCGSIYTFTEKPRASSIRKEWDIDMDSPHTLKVVANLKKKFPDWKDSLKKISDLDQVKTVVSTVGDIRKYIADLPDDMPLVYPGQKEEYRVGISDSYGDGEAFCIHTWDEDDE